MTSFFVEPLVILIQAVFGVLIWAIVCRFMLQVARADFYNPVSQFLVKITNPMLRPLRRYVPGYHGIDAASIVLAIGLQMIELGLLRLLAGPSFINGGLLLLHACAELLSIVIYIYMFCMIIQAVASWIAPGGYNPALRIIQSLTEPLSARIRRYIPTMSGIDFSPLIAIVGMQILQATVVKGLHLIALTFA